MNFTKKLLLSAALIIGFVAAGFAQETTTVGSAGDYEVWVSSDGKLSGVQQTLKMLYLVSQRQLAQSCLKLDLFYSYLIME